MDIHKGNIEEYLLLLMDGELNDADEMEVMAFIESSPEHKALLDEYLLTKLETETILFEDKELLLKQEPAVVSFNRKKVYTAWAAAIAILICTGGLFKMLHQKPVLTEPLVMHHSNENTRIDSISKPSLAVKENETEEAVKPVAKHPFNTKHNTVAANTSTIAVVAIPKVESLNSLPVADLKLMEMKPDEPLVASEMIVAAISNTPSGNIIANEDDDPELGRRALLNNLIAQVDVLKDKVAEKTRSIRISAVSIQLGNKEFTIGK